MQKHVFMCFESPFTMMIGPIQPEIQVPPSSPPPELQSAQRLHAASGFEHVMWGSCGGKGVHVTLSFIGLDIGPTHDE